MPAPARLAERVQLRSSTAAPARSASVPTTRWCRPPVATCRAAWWSRPPGRPAPAGCWCATCCAWGRGTTWTSVPGRIDGHRPTSTPSTACCALVRCVSGSVDLSMTCEPSFDFAPRRADLGVRRHRLRRGRGHGRGAGRLAAADHGPAARHRGARAARAHPDDRGREPLRRAVLVAAAAAADPGRRRGAAAAHLRVLAAVDHPRRLPGPPVAQLPAAQRADPQGADLRADRRAASPPPRPRCPRRRTASATGTTATPGSATRPSRCGGSTPSASTARPTTSSTSSPTCAATARTCR